MSMKYVVDAHQREFEPNQDFENVQLEENSQEDLIDDEFQEEETTPSEEIADFIRKQGKIYGGGQIILQEKVNLCTRINALNSEQRQIDI